MKPYLTLLLALTLSALPAVLFAQTPVDTSFDAPAEEDDEVVLMPARRHDRYLSNAMDAGILSIAVTERPGMDRNLSRLRFSFIANLGLHFNYDFDPGFGMFTGLGIKNIGFSERPGDSVIIRRVYTIGAPLGFKLGSIMARNYFFAGGGVDIPFHYKEKTGRGKDKIKTGAFFSDKTASVMPYVFAGACFKPGLMLKLQFYPSNFYNIDYEEVNQAGTTIRPFRGHDARLLLLSLGLDIHYRKSEKPTNTPM